MKELLMIGFSIIVLCASYIAFCLIIYLFFIFDFIHSLSQDIGKMITNKKLDLK